MRGNRGETTPQSAQKGRYRATHGSFTDAVVCNPTAVLLYGRAQGWSTAARLYIRKHQHKTPEYKCKCVRTLYIYIATCKFTFGYGREGHERQGGTVCGCGAESRDDAGSARQGEKGGWAMASQSLPAPFHPPWRKKRSAQSRAGEWRRRDRDVTH